MRREVVFIEFISIRVWARAGRARSRCIRFGIVQRRVEHAYTQMGGNMELSLRGRDALEAVGALYQSAMSECDASAVLGTLAGLLHCEHAVLATRDGRGWQWESSGAMTGSARSSMDQICQEFFSSIDQGQRADGLVRTSDVMDLRALARSDLYQEHLKPLNGGLSLMVHGRVEGDHIALALCRPLLESADFSTSDVQVTGAMWPHIKRAHLLRRALACRIRPRPPECPRRRPGPGALRFQ